MSDRSKTQYRKSGQSTGSYGKGTGGGPAPSPSSSLPSSNRCFKKSHNAPQGGHSRTNVPTVNSSDSTNNASADSNVQNAAHSEPQIHGASDVPFVGGAAKEVELSAPQRSTQAVAKAPSSQSTSMSLDSTAPATQAKAPEEPSKAFHFQFDSIGMQIPVRTTSVLPNLDEQKRDQVHQDTYNFVPKQQMPRKDAVAPDQSSTVEVHQMPMVKKGPQVSLPPTTNQTQKPYVLPIPITSMQMPFHQPQVYPQFGGHNPQIHSQNVTATSFPSPMPITLQMGNAPQMQQHMFVSGLQPHPMQPQGLMHQGQGMGFSTHMGPPQLPLQLGNMGMGKTPQYPQQQEGKFGGCSHKTVIKITHPDTHKEVRFDERVDTYPDGEVSGPRSQSQLIPSFAHAHPINHHPNPFGAGSIYYPAPDSLPLGSQITPNIQTTTFNYMVSQGPQNVSFMNPNLNSLPISKAGTPMTDVAEPPNLNRSKSSTAGGKKKRKEIYDFSKRMRATISFLDQDDTTHSRFGPKTSEVYGFVGSITTVVAAAIFLVWAYVPERCLNAIGISYYPSRYWALAVPAYAMVTLVLALVFYIGLNFMSTPLPTSLNQMFDEFSRESSNSVSFAEEGDDQPIEPISHIGIHKINALMFNDVN